MVCRWLVLGMAEGNISNLHIQKKRPPKREVAFQITQPGSGAAGVLTACPVSTQLASGTATS